MPAACYILMHMGDGKKGAVAAKVVMAAVLSLGLLLPSQEIAHGDSFFSNTIDKNPILSKNLSVYLLDLSRSVDHNIMMAGFNNLQSNVANVFAVGGNQSGTDSAASYYQWIPIRGSENNSASLPLFTEDDDAALWSSARAVKGKSNQLTVLRKLKERNGLWSQLMNTQGLNTTNCLEIAHKAFVNPGLSGPVFQNLNQNVCAIALRVRSRFSIVQSNIIAFTGKKPIKKTSGTDILGTIRKLEDVSRNSTIVKRYKDIRLIFVSDMVHQTALIDLKSTLIGMTPEAACALVDQFKSKASGFDKSIFRVTMYGLGEMMERKNLGKINKNSIATNEKLYPVLREFWNCFWVQKGLAVPDSEFKSLASFAENS